MKVNHFRIIPLLILIIIPGVFLFLINGDISDIGRFLGTPFRSLYNWGNFLNRSGIILIAASGTFLASQAGLLNLGGEGQAAIGGISAYIISTLFPEIPVIFTLPLLLISSFLAGAINSILAAWLKNIAEIDVLITSYLVSGGTLVLCESLISGALRDPESYLITTKAFPKIYQLNSWLPPSKLNITLVISLIILIILVVILKKTIIGFHIDIIGKQRDFARYAGIKVKKNELLVMAASGGLHGMAGALFLFGNFSGGVSGFSTGIGWDALTASLLAANNPFAILPAVLAINWIEEGSKNLILSSGFPIDFTQMITGSIFILFAIKPLFIRKISR